MPFSLRLGNAADDGYRLTADALKGHESSTLQALARTVARDFPRRVQVGVALQAYDDVMGTLLRSAIDGFNMSSLVPGNRAPAHQYPGQHTGHYFGHHSAYSAKSSDQMIALVKFCFEVGAQNYCQRLLLRFVPPPAGTTVAQHVSSVLAPFLPVLRQYLAGQRLDFQSEPYRMFAAAVVRAFAEHVMGQKPSEVVSVAQLQGVGCQGCAECKTLRSFFLSDQATVSFRRTQTIRSHIERHLAATRAWGVSWETIRVGSPHTLKVRCRPPLLFMRQGIESWLDYETG